MRSALVAGCLMLAACGPSAEEVTKQREAQVAAEAKAAAIKSLLDRSTETLLDPEGARFRNVKFHRYEMCGEINSKNAFGAYTGYDQFYTLSDKPPQYAARIHALDDVPTQRKLMRIFDKLAAKCFAEGEPVDTKTFGR
jgi:hypothetical protein